MIKLILVRTCALKLYISYPKNNYKIIHKDDYHDDDDNDDDDDDDDDDMMII